MIAAPSPGPGAHRADATTDPMIGAFAVLTFAAASPVVAARRRVDELPVEIDRATTPPATTRSALTHRRGAAARQRTKPPAARVATPAAHRNERNTT
jgi:hypothetical protein